MTERKTISRPRRRVGRAELPETLRQWFAGELADSPWCALIYSSNMLLQDRWREWKAEHPEARPPAGFEWLDGPDYYAPEEIKEARRSLRHFEREFPDQAGRW